ncbi:glycosyltransferase family 4 protein [Cryobacterium tagatosivorans]|uniref:D-inositol 3-phosphate glycosyltransferase n=1 Tax=Cryobacterium tagatosivorans TaxID=1259199 RepID=A0A4R8UFA7_9MICO|nr:glycosyltransferase family 4 protein [Cryobacterium tagatosivorans]TFB51742.1 glycosyltransferase [Cryobacterium tagatosivorans]
MVYPHSMEIGGSQKNAIDIAGSLQARGHEVVVFGPPGPLVDLLAERGLRHEPAPRPRIRPSQAVMGRLCDVVEELNADVVHGFEWPPAVEAVFGPYRRLNVPAVCSVMSMSVAPFLPHWLPLTVGTESILRSEQAKRPQVTLLEPPVDTRRDRPIDQLESKALLGIDPGTLVVSLVTRLAAELKREGILTAISAVGRLATEFPVRLVIAGDGPARAEVESAARRANAAAGTDVVRLTGDLPDPRAVYDAADIALGMGGSALRAMAFGKPLVVQGESGFWRLLEPGSLPEFVGGGWFGIGDGGDGAARLAALLRPLLADAALRGRLGEFARATVESRYGLDAATEALEAFYGEAIGRHRSEPRAMSRLLGPYLSVTRYELDRKVKRRLGGVVRDDFNSLAAMRAQEQRGRSR